MIPAVTDTITGPCGSACGGGNPAVEVSFQGGGIGHKFMTVGCGAGWVVHQTGNDPYCTFDTTANVNLNQSPIAYYTSCDGLAPGNYPACSSETFNITVTVLATSVVAFAQAAQQCECLEHEVEVNQKYYVTSNNFMNGPEGYGWLGIGAIFGNYEWIGTGLNQACTSVYLPNLYYYGNTVTLIYKGVKPKPTKMPGRYLNGDVPAMTNDAGTLFSSLPIGAGDQIRVYQKGGNPFPSIYDWNNTDTRDRGPGGYPTTPCQGQPLN